MRPDEFASFTRRVAEGGPVDWDDAERTASDERQRELIRQLRALHTTSWAPRSDVKAPPPDPVAVSGLWGHLRVMAQLGGRRTEVFRAWDTRLERSVALKLLPADAPAETETRLLDAARAFARVRHPHVVTIYGADRDSGRVGLWMEVVEGHTIEHLLRTFGPMSVGEALVTGITISGAAGALHRARVIHNAITTRNVMRERGGRYVLMDSADAPTTLDEEAAQYAAPEVLAGGRPTEQSDIYALGVLLFYLVTADFPVVGRSVDQIRDAHTEDRARRLHDLRPDLPAAYVAVVERALATDPARRYRSTAELESALIDAGREAHVPVVTPAAPLATGRRGTLRTSLLLASVLAAVALLALALAPRWIATASDPGQPGFSRMTFQQGRVLNGRFSPDGRMVVYSAEWSGLPRELFSTGFGSQESRSLGLQDATLLAVSSRGELAVLLRPRFLRGYIESGTLARVSLGGGAPREVLADVQEADWSPDGANLAIVHDVNGRCRLEYPFGTTLYETGGWVSDIRVSPDGERIAFIDHPVPADDSGSIVVIDRNANRNVLTKRWVSAHGVAWSPDGEDVWFTATDTGAARGLYAVSRDGDVRYVRSSIVNLRIHDVARDGRMLISEEHTRVGVMALAPAATSERDLSWLDWSIARDISDDGRYLLINESGEGGGPQYGVYLRKTDGSPAVRLADGSGMAISPDNRWVLATGTESPAQLFLLPTTAGQPRPLPRGTNRFQQWGAWFPDGKRVLFAGNEPGAGSRLYVQDIDGGGPRAITTEGVFLTTSRPISPDGRSIAAVGPDQRITLFAADGSASSTVPGAEAGEVPVGWSADGRHLIVWRRGEAPARLQRLDISSGAREQLRALMPADPTGVHEILRIAVTRDASAYAYSFTRELSVLHQVTGIAAKRD